MTTVNIEIKNSSRILNAFRQAPQIMASKLQEAILKVGVFTVGEVKKTITAGIDMWKPPILTGAMRQGINVMQTMPLKVIITPSPITPYAIYVHEGTYKMKARPFFEITAKHSQEDIEKFFNQALNNAVQEIASKAK